jgi:hypothetical protein
MMASPAACGKDVIANPMPRQRAAHDAAASAKNEETEAEEQKTQRKIEE